MASSLQRSRATVRGRRTGSMTGPDEKLVFYCRTAPNASFALTSLASAVRVAVAIASVLFFVAVPAASALNAPTLLSVAHTKRHPTATWSLPAWV
jgi:hypothetical protein